MSHFYGTLQGHRGEATRCGTKSAGITTYAASWCGAIRVKVYHEDGEDKFVVSQRTWQGDGIDEFIAQGTLGKSIKGETND